MKELLSRIDPATLIWLVLFVVFIVGEIATVGLTMIWFAAGALVAMIASLCGANILIQILLFIVVSVGCLALTKAKVQDFINRHTQRTNADRAIGQIIHITERVSNREQSGRAVFAGVDWAVRTRSDDEVIEAGESARVLEISGVRLIVEKV